MFIYIMQDANLLFKIFLDNEELVKIQKKGQLLCIKDKCSSIPLVDEEIPVPEGKQVDVQ